MTRLERFKQAASATWGQFIAFTVVMLEVAIFPIHFVLHLLIVQLLPLVALVLIVLVGPALVFEVANQRDVVDRHLTHWLSSGLFGDTAAFAAFVSVLGIIPMIVGKLWHRVIESARSVLVELIEVLSGPWWPELQLPNAFKKTVETLHSRTKGVITTVRASFLLVSILVVIAFAALLAQKTMTKQESSPDPDHLVNKLKRLDLNVSLVTLIDGVPVAIVRATGERIRALAIVNQLKQDLNLNVSSVRIVDGVLVATTHAARTGPSPFFSKGVVFALSPTSATQG